MRLIDADALRESVLKWLPHDPCGVEENEYPYETDICVSMLMEIEDAPTVQPDTDTVSRQAAINALHDEIVRRRIDEDLNDDGELDEFDTEAILRQLPPSLSRQQDPDTVSRQAVFDAVKDLTKWSLLDRFDRHVGVGVKYYEVQEAVKSLPPSLSRQQDPDTVSRKSVIDALIAEGRNVDSRYLESERIIHESDAIEAISMLPPSPSRQAEPQWIPVTERLPEGKQEVLVTEYGETDIGRRFDGRWLDRYGDKMKDVTAWMEKPKPYKGVHHE